MRQQPTARQPWIGGLQGIEPTQARQAFEGEFNLPAQPIQPDPLFRRCQACGNEVSSISKPAASTVRGSVL